jgi:SSS family solute:Na+ symporter
MHPIDTVVLALYFLVILGIGLYFLRRQESPEEYFVGDRKMGAGHIAFSVVATDVGGGFSIGLGGLGFSMGLAGSWLLFTGLVGAWLSAVLLVPTVKRLGDQHSWLSYPDFLAHRFDQRTAVLAALVSAIGYAGFVGAQILAGGKLASAAFDVSLLTAVLVMALVVILYTSFGGLQAVVYTDSVQWSVLLVGLLAVALPLSWIEVGGLEGIREAVPAGHLELTNIAPKTFLTWMLTVIPIWFVAMTLYQRIYATRDESSARRAWYLAGLLEYPLMAFAGVSLGLIARVMFPEVEAEMGLPLLIREILPVGLTGVVVAAYFSAIISTADSCLLASVGNVVGDLVPRLGNRRLGSEATLGLSRVVTLILGLLSVGVALAFPKVLDAVLISYAFMVSGLFVPTLGGLLWKRTSANTAFASMLVGGGLAVLLNVFPALDVFGEPILLALPASALILLVGNLVGGEGHRESSAPPSSGM